MDVLIGICAGIGGLAIGYVWSFIVQQKKINQKEEAVKKWQAIVTVHEQGTRITASVIKVTEVRGTNNYRIKAQWQSPNTRDKYPFEGTFAAANHSPAFIRKLDQLETVKVKVIFGDTPQRYAYRMECPW